MVVCADDAVARKVRLLRNQGMERRYANEVVGFNMRMTDLHAAIGRVQLRRLPDWTAAAPAQRHVPRSRARRRRGASDWCCRRWRPGAEPVWHQYTVRSPQRDRLVTTLAEQGSEHRACTTRHRSTGCPPTGSTSACPHRPGRGARSCRCRCTRPCRPAQLDHVVTRRAGGDPGGDAVTAHRCAPGLSGSAAWAATTPASCGPCPGSSWWLPSTPATRSARTSRSSTSSARSTRSSTAGSTCASWPPRRSPTRTIALQLAEAGVATLVEKPLAHDAKAAQAIAEAFERAGCWAASGTSSGSTRRCRTCARRLAAGSSATSTRWSPAGRAPSRPASSTPGSSSTWPPTTSTSPRG